MSSIMITVEHEVEVFYDVLPHGTPYITHIKVQNTLPPDSADIERYIENQAMLKWYDLQKEDVCPPSMKR